MKLVATIVGGVTAGYGYYAIYFNVLKSVQNDISLLQQYVGDTIERDIRNDLPENPIIKHIKPNISYLSSLQYESLYTIITRRRHFADIIMDAEKAVATEVAQRNSQRHA